MQCMELPNHCRLYTQPIDLMHVFNFLPCHLNKREGASHDAWYMGNHIWFQPDLVLWEADSFWKQLREHFLLGLDLRIRRGITGLIHNFAFHMNHRMHRHWLTLHWTYITILRVIEGHLSSSHVEDVSQGLFQFSHHWISILDNSECRFDWGWLIHGKQAIQLSEWRLFCCEHSAMYVCM